MFKLPDLPFDAAALEPLMSATTLNIHHGKHHATYIKNMNAAVAERSDAPDTVEGIVRLAARENNKKLFNNAAQAWNHAFFWQSLTPTQQGDPQGDLKLAIEIAFGAIAAFREQFVAQGAAHFASGWVWLVSDRFGALKLIDLHDAETPIVEVGTTPLLVCDLWEHAYYLDYKNERPKFLSAFIEKLANWRFAEAQYDAARKGEGAWSFPT